MSSSCVSLVYSITSHLWYLHLIGNHWVYHWPRIDRAADDINITHYCVTYLVSCHKERNFIGVPHLWLTSYLWSLSLKWAFFNPSPNWYRQTHTHTHTHARTHARHHCLLLLLLLLPVSPLSGSGTDPGASGSPASCWKGVTESVTLNPLCYPNSYWAEL